jgi:hypothetical protein
MADWWDKGTKIPLNDGNFQKIIDFYLFNCPVIYRQKKGKVISYKPVSARSKTFIDQGWVNHMIPTLLSEMKQTSKNLKYHILSSSEDPVSIMDYYSRDDENNEIVAFLEREDMGNTYAIFYGIRNAFAHGSFSVIKCNKETIYLLQSKKEKDIKTIMKLNEKTLLKWIELFNSTVEELKEIKQNRKRAKNQEKRQKSKEKAV